MLDHIDVRPRWDFDAERVSVLRAEYLAVAPWPHLVLHDPFSADLLHRVRTEIGCLERARMRGSHTRRHEKLEMSDREQLGPATRALQDYLDSPPFVAFLSAVTGVEELLADEMHYAAGVHETPQGGRTMVHRDFAHHPVTRLHHRVNVLVYLNPGWQDDWGGQLELWRADMSELGASIQPLFNTMVVWETHAGTPHGLPSPIGGPPGTSRLALASYYYTEMAAPERTRPKMLDGTYLARPVDSRWTALPLPRDIGRRLLPAGVQRRVWRLLDVLRS
jgi:Rps23 Pro-64 3,4-dihydroxylase Tpa1-like proline 4-hydroxylase